MNIIRKIKNWYKGERIEDWQSTGPYGLPEFYYQKSPSAKLITSIVKFWRNHWAWAITILVTILGICVTAGVALFMHFDNKPQKKNPATRKAEYKANAAVNYASIVAHVQSFPFKT